MSKQDLADYLRNRQKTLGLTGVNIAEKAGITRMTWHRLLTGGVDEAKLKTLIKLGEVLETHPMILIRILLMDNPELEQHTEGIKTGYNTHFVADITYPDNSCVGVGERFIKIWKVVNIGTKVWENLYLQCVDESITTLSQPANQDQVPATTMYGLKPDETRVAIPTTLPNQSVQLTVAFTAPSLPCSAMSHWKMVDAEGNFLFSQMHGVYCMVRVIDK